jgi:RNA polymerase sigma-70 factor (ECF subfamily)
MSIVDLEDGVSQVGGSEPLAGFRTFYERHHVEVFRFVRRRLPQQDAEEVVAQVFTVAWRRFRDVPAPPEDRLWLFGVARRASSDHLRTAVRRRRLATRLGEQPRPQVGEQFSTVAQASVAAAVAALKPKDREVLLLLLWDDLSHAEAAEVLGCSVNAVELRFRRAIARIRTSIASADGDDVRTRHEERDR